MLNGYHHEPRDWAVYVENYTKANHNPAAGKGDEDSWEKVWERAWEHDPSTAVYNSGVIIQSDFKSLEVYLQAILTKCDQLIKDLRAGLDMHCVRVSQKEHITYEEALLRCKGDESKGIEAIKEWEYKRTAAKVFSFQRAYGAGAKKISDSTGVPIEDIEALIVAENQRYPEIEKYYEELGRIVKANRKPWRTVPHPTMPGVMCPIGKSWVRTPDGKLYAYQEQPAPDYIVKSRDPAKRALATFSPTELKNYVVQGEGGEWAKAAMWLAVRAFYARRNFNHRALLVNQVHDALYADSAHEVRIEAAALLHASMEAASEFMEWFFKWPCPVPVPSDTNWGASMMGPEKTKDPAALALRREESQATQSKAAEYRKELRNLYMAGYVPSFDNQVKENA